jgi:ferredoxin-NADP reductase
VVVGTQPDELFELVVATRHEVAEGIVALELTAPGGGELPAWAPGAHIDLVLGPELERQFSLCGDPADRSRWRIAVLREDAGRGGSAYVHDRLAGGAHVRARGPRNHFPLEPADDYLFIAGGIGITPLLPMIAQAAQAGAEWRLVYGGRRAASMAFVDELAACGSAPSRIDLWPQDERGLIDLDTLLAEPRPGCRIYCCGPEPLLEAVDRLVGGWPPHTLRTERFSPKAHALDGPTSGFVVRLDYSDLEVRVGPDQSIAEAVEAVGIDIVTSCREGTCGTCETVVLDGVPDHRDSILSDEERAANDLMMICCSRSFSPVLVLDL